MMKENIHISIDLIDLPIAICNADGEILYANPEFAKIKTQGGLKQSVLQASDQENDSDNIGELRDYLGEKAAVFMDLIRSGTICSDTIGLEICDEFLGKIAMIELDNSPKYLLTLINCKNFGKSNNASPPEILPTKTKDNDKKKLKEALLLEELRRNNEELKEFATSISHDLQEPLRTISNFLKVLKIDEIEAISKPAAENIRFSLQAATRMQHMINDLLSYSRIQLCEMEFKFIDFNDIMSGVQEILSRSIQIKGAKIICSELPDSVECHESQIKQLFMSLVSNALKFSRQTEAPVIIISYKEKDDYMIFSIEDNGLGIEQKDFKRIFQVFQRLHTKDEYPGTGIGLAICKKIITRHGGAIWLESEVNKGSIFYFSLPKRQVSNHYQIEN